MGAYSPEMFGNSNTATGMPQVMPGGDGYDPWARGGIPPQGAPPQGSYPMPQYIPPTGQYYDGNLNPNSPFMAPDGNTYILVPKNANSNVNTQPSKRPAANANVQPTAPAAAKPSPPAPAANTATPAETTPPVKATPKPTAAPKNNTTQKTTPSGKELDT
jgi:cell division septation protein DedD